MSWQGESDRHGLASRGIATGRARKRHSHELERLEKKLRMQVNQVALYRAQSFLEQRGLAQRQIKKIQAESDVLDRRIAADLRAGKLKVTHGASGRDQFVPTHEKLTKHEIREAHALAHRMEHHPAIKEPYALATWETKKKHGVQ